MSKAIRKISAISAMRERGRWVRLKKSDCNPLLRMQVQQHWIQVHLSFMGPVHGDMKIHILGNQPRGVKRWFEREVEQPVDM